MYTKLGVSLNQPLKQAYLESFKILSNLYFTQKLSVIEIFKKTGICHKTLKSLFDDFETPLRTLSEGQQIAVQECRTSPPSGKRYKQGFLITWEGLKFYYRSSYEKQYAEDLNKKKVPYRMEAFRVPYWNTKKQDWRIAIPDFYLPETNELVEIKSRWTYREQEMKDKFRAYRELGYRPKLLLEHEELDL